LKISKEKREQVTMWLTTTTSSLEAPVGDEAEGQVIDLVEDEAALQPDATIEHMLDKERVDNLLEIMAKREREILDMRFGLADGKPRTLAEVAKKLGVSRERVRQIEDVALKKLQKIIKDHDKEL
ncbi:MAG: sigma-70 family RNA polymerase sigma factor, partial [Candidatus Omnitrophica bacterium]|nr:sigma-70 family RNA polymerase sigma factor [Candidatus Omnitrophota bacterium]